MNWKRPFADDVEAAAFGLKLDSILAVASRYSKLAPVLLAACLIEPAILRRDGSMRDAFARAGSIAAAAVALAAVAFMDSTDMYRRLAFAKPPHGLTERPPGAHAVRTVGQLWLMAG